MPETRRREEVSRADVRKEIQADREGLIADVQGLIEIPLLQVFGQPAGAVIGEVMLYRTPGLPLESGRAIRGGDLEANNPPGGFALQMHAAPTT